MANAKSKALEKKRAYGLINGRTYPHKSEVTELRKHRGERDAEAELSSYRRYKKFSKASGTWGKKNSKNY